MFLESGLSAHYNLPVNLDEWTDAEIRHWLILRAIEWTNWPAFLSQLLAPLLLVAVWWPVVIIGVLVADLLWVPIRYSFVSPVLANLACFAVRWAKWPVAVGSAACLLIHRSYLVGILALCWPVIAIFVCIPGKVGRVELAFAKKIGYVEQAEES